MKWRVILEPDPETGEVWCPELPGCTSAGETEDEALRNIQDAIALFASPALRAIALGREAIVLGRRGAIAFLSRAIDF